MAPRTIKAGFLPLYLKLYEDITPGAYKLFEEFIRDTKNLLVKSGVTLADPGIVYEEKHVEKAKDLFLREQVSFIITLHLCYSPSLLIADFLERFDLPILILDTTPDSSFENMRDDYLTKNHGIHGVMDLTSVLKSRGVSFFAVAGHAENPEFVERLKKTISAFIAGALFRNQVIGITGKPFAGMGDFAVDFNRLKNAFGITVKDIPVDRLIAENGKVDTKDIEAGMAAEKKTWKAGTATDEVYRESTRSYLALKSIAEKEGLSGYTMNFRHITGGMATPFYACSRLMADGIGYGGEGDVLTATLGVPLNYLSKAAKFDEFFCADWKNDFLLMSHMGETDPRFADPKAAGTLEARDGFVNPRLSVIYRFKAEPGPVTFVNISPLRGEGWRMVVGLLEIVDKPVLEKIEGPHFHVKPDMPVVRFLERYADAGGGHHLYLAKGNILEQVMLMGKVLGFEVLSIT